MHLWSAGSLSLAGVEPWPDFHGRVEQGIRNITASGPRGRRVIAFTSVGPISIFLKSALAVSNRQALELGWRLRNCSITEILFTDERMTLDCFNALPHLDSSELVTFR